MVHDAPVLCLQHMHAQRVVAASMGTQMDVISCTQGRLPHIHAQAGNTSYGKLGAEFSTLWHSTSRLSGCLRYRTVSKQVI